MRRFTLPFRAKIWNSDILQINTNGGEFDEFVLDLDTPHSCAAEEEVVGWSRWLHGRREFYALDSQWGHRRRSQCSLIIARFRDYYIFDNLTRLAMEKWRLIYPTNEHYSNKYIFKWHSQTTIDFINKDSFSLVGG